jgi:riboflavin transporter FmnP
MLFLIKLLDVPMKMCYNYVMNKSKIQARTLVSIALLAAISYILTLVSFPLPFMPSFLKLDFSDFPSLLAAFTFGPFSGVAVQFIKNAVAALSSSSAGIGELANFVMGGSLAFTSGLIYKKRHTMKGAVASLIIGTLIMSLAACVMNYFVLFPLYSAFMPLTAIIKSASEFVPFIKTKLDVMIFTIFPFNLIKGTIISIITFLLYKRLKPLMKKAGGA